MGDQKKKYVNVRFSMPEYQCLTEKAKKGNFLRAGKICLSQYIRYVTLNNQKIIVLDDLKPFVKELNAIGNNVNQLTKLANMRKIDVVYLNEVNDKMNRIYDLLIKINQQLNTMKYEMENGEQINGCNKND